MELLKWQVAIDISEIYSYDCYRVDFLVPFTSIKDTCIESFYDWYALGVL